MKTKPTNDDIKKLDLELRAVLGMTAQITPSDGAWQDLAHAVRGAAMLIEEQRKTIERLRSDVKVAVRALEASKS